MELNSELKEEKTPVLQEEVLQKKAEKCHKLRRKKCHPFRLNRICRFEELEKRELLAASPIDVGAVYVEQWQEDSDIGDRFYIAWVGGEESTTLDSVVINLDKNLNGVLENAEGYFDTGTDLNGRGVYASSPFRVVEALTSDNLNVLGYEVEDGGQTLKINFENFHAGDNFCFTIDVDEYEVVGQSENDNAGFEGAEMGGVRHPDIINGSHIEATFTSTHYETAVWNGMYLEKYDDATLQKSTRPEALANEFDDEIGATSTKLPYDLNDNVLGFDSAGIYETIILTPKPIEISGYVYADINVDCHYDIDSDEPLANVEVTLLSSTGETWTTSTNEEGLYIFGTELKLLPGEYTIQCQTNVSSPSGKTFYDFCAAGGTYGEKVDPLHIVVDGVPGGGKSVDNNFSKVLPGSIDGYVFEDLNNKDNKEPGEEGISNVEVELWKLQDSTWVYVESQVTNDSGYYRFEIDGTRNADGIRKNVNCYYEVREGTIPAEYSDGKDYIGSLGGDTEPEVFTNIMVGYDQDGVNYNFGELKLGSIAGNVFEDRNNNGEWERDSEDPIANVKILLYKFDGEKYVDTGEVRYTDDNGAYLFDNLEIGYEYAVKEIQETAIDPNDGEIYDNGKMHLGTLGGEKDEEASYFFTINVGWDQHGTDYDYGELRLGYIEGNVYEDRNDNGYFEEELGEKGITEAIKIGLYQWNGTDYVFVRETTTENGFYYFDKLDINGVYAVREMQQPTDYVDGKTREGSLGGEVSNDYPYGYIKAINVGWADCGVDYNFGELKLGSIAGNVYNDLNNNGIFDRPVEKGIGAVTVILYQWTANDQAEGQWSEIARKVTNEDGSYLFDNLNIEERYAIREIQPEGWNDGIDTPGTINGKTVGVVREDDFIEDVDIAWDNHGIEYNFGELKPLSPGGLSGYVYVDANNNGIMEDWEIGIENVTLKLWLYDTESGIYKFTERMALTDEQGYYYFLNLDPEQMYRITEIQPSNYDDGIDTPGTLGGIAGNDEIYDIEVHSGDYGVYYNFGELEKEDPDPDPDPPHDGNNYNPSPQIILPPNNYYSAPGYSFNYIQNTPIESQHTVSYFGGGGLPTSYSWHLSVLNGGYPRSIEAMESTAGYRAYLGATFSTVSFSAAEDMTEGEWIIRKNDGTVMNRYNFGTQNSVPVIGDWNGDGRDSIGVFSNGRWILDRNGDGLWNEDDLLAELGNHSDQPVTGDWDGDGKTDIGIFGPQNANDLLAVAIEPGLPTDLNQYITVSRPKNIPPDFDTTSVGHRTLVHRNNGQMRLDLIDHVFEYGTEGDVAVTGDWNGDGISKIGVYRKGVWFLDVNGNGKWDEGDIMVEHFASELGIPVVGDFNGDGIDNIGIFNNGKWVLDGTGDYKPDMYFTFGQEGDIPYAGDFDGDGHAEVGVYRPAADSEVAVKNN